jgi:S1-C subfamily serine protease
VEGSGWVAAPEVVVTNAHVVAGESDTSVQVGGQGVGLRARVIDFDSHDDIAILRVPGLGGRPLKMAAAARAGTSAAILGYPLDGGFDAEPGRIGQTQTVSTEDAYGHGPVTRTIVALRGRVRPGNSGGPMVTSNGEVAAMVFAAITSGGVDHAPGGFAVPDSLIRARLGAAKGRLQAVGTGPCG